MSGVISGEVPQESSEAQRTVVVTGASAGIGVAIAKALGALGWTVAIGARRVGRLEQTAVAVEAAGGRVFAHELDVASPDSIERFFTALEARYGHADAVVNNAGISLPGLLHEVAPEDLQQEITVNLLGPMWVARRAIPAMLEAKHGDLLFIGSDNSDNPRPFQAGYSASKAGLLNLTRVLAMELEATGVRVTNLRLGPTASEFGLGWDPELLGRIIQEWRRIGLMRNNAFMQPEVVAEIVVQALRVPRGATLANIELQPTAPVPEASAELD